MDVKFYFKKANDGPVLSDCGPNGTMPVLSIEVESNQDAEHVKSVVLPTIHALWDMSFW